MGVIFFLSHQDKDASRNTSEWVMAVLNVLNLDIDVLRAYHVPLLVRKAAHMTEYFVLFLLTHRLLNWYRPEQSNWGYAFLFCIFYACTDEYHQSFVPGRGASILDVGIDSCGATIALFVERLWQRIKHTVSLRKASSP